ncbi:MAG TPA: hypothetical protein VKT78_06450 [Fimbriimonadaceae bacterium]|nr:hypothetical protein [Fimbriimonadaceae bacterium]
MGEPLLMTDGTVLVLHPNSSDCWKLTPDINGNYQTGTWTQLASLPSGYGPLYYASAVLADGRVVVMGGEYNESTSGVWTNLGAIYDPVANVWTPLTAPASWPNIGDAQCTVLPNGQFVMANPYDGGMAVLDPTTLAFTLLNGTGKADGYDEEGWVLLADGTILTIDVSNGMNGERYIPSLDQWIPAGASPVGLTQSSEIGPSVLRPDGTVFAMGASGHNAIYTPPTNLMDPGSWVAGPDFPVISGKQVDIADGPSCVLPSGNVLCQASPGVYNAPSYFFEFTGTTLTQVASPGNAGTDPSYVGNMLMLPSGQVFYTDFSGAAWIYTPSGTPQTSWLPTITTSPSFVAQGQTYLVSGTQFNGLTQCSGYGDDSTNATNYPIVRIKNNTTGHVFYCRTHNHSTMGVATGATPVSTSFDVPTTVETGASTLVVVANGIASAPQAISVVPAHTVLPSAYSLFRGVLSAGSLSSLYFADGNTLQVLIGPTLNTSESPIQVVSTGLSPTLTPTSIKITVRSAVNTPGTSETIALWDYATSAYVTVDSRPMTTTYQTVTVTVPGNASDYIGAGGAIQAKVSYAQTGPTIVNRWQANVDMINWMIQ